MKKYTEKQIRQIIAQMSPAEKAGQLFLLAYPGKDPQIIRSLIESYGISGCYISQDNAETFDEARCSSAHLQHMAAETAHSIPLMLGVDQEGAWGVLVPESHTGPGNQALGSVKNPQHIRDMYGVFGREMLSVGYNTLLGPCADVNIDPKSPIIDTRSFGEYPQRVASCVSQAIRGAAETGIITTLKHFPGHGGTSGDSHREIPRVEKTLNELMETDILPFRYGIEAGADMVMTSHILYPLIDPDQPATLSPTILKGLLRDTLGFRGVILSDSMNMGAIRRFYHPAESTLMALKAGVDIVMLSEEHYDHSENYLSRQIASLELVKQAILDKELTEQDVDEKLIRILDLKLNRMRIKGPDLSEKEQVQIRGIESNAARESFLLLQKGLWPLPETGSILCINATPRSSYANMMNSRGIGPNQEKPAFDIFRETMDSLNSSAGILLNFLSHQEAVNAEEEVFAAADALILVTEDYPLPGETFEKAAQQQLVRKLSLCYKEKTLILGLRSSYELTEYPEDVTYLCAGSSRSCSAEAAAQILLSHHNEFSGIAPVSSRLKIESD